MTAFPVADFTRDAGVEFPRESAVLNARARSRPDEARDRAGPGDEREYRVSDFDKALRARDSNETSRPRSERATGRQRDKDVAAAGPARDDEAAAEVQSRDPRAADSRGAAKSEAAAASGETSPGAEQPEQLAALKPEALLPQVVQVVSAAAPKNVAAISQADANAGADPEPAADGAGDPSALAPVPGAASRPALQTQDLPPAPAPGVPASAQAQQHASAPDGETAAAAPLAAPGVAKPMLNAEARVRPETQTAASTAPAQPGEPDAAAPDVKPEGGVRQMSERSARQAETPAQGPVSNPAQAAKNAVQPVAALQSAMKAAAQSAQDLKAPDAQAADAKTSAPAQPSIFAAQLEARPGQIAGPHAGAAPHSQASPNAAAIASNVVRFFRETGSGSARFDIRLDPAELGRVDARVEINHDRTVTLTLSAERPETLAELMRTARDLERQLTDSGVKLSDDGLKFRLNSDARGDAQQNMQDGSGGRRPARGAYAAGAESALQADAAIPMRGWRVSGVDVWA